MAETLAVNGNIDYDDVIPRNVHDRFICYFFLLLHLPFSQRFRILRFDLILVNKNISAKMFSRYVQNMRSYSSSNKDFIF